MNVDIILIVVIAGHYRGYYQLCLLWFASANFIQRLVRPYAYAVV